MTVTKGQEISQSSNSLLAQAIANNASIETLERLMALEERYLANKAKSEYYKAMSLLQSEMPDFKRTKKVKFSHKDGSGLTEYNYTPLGDMIKALKPLLKKHGFSYQYKFTQTQNGLIKCDCISTHKAGHQETTSMEAARDESGKKNNIQSIGSTRTYLQRYTLKAGFGLTSDEDDNDGRSAADPKKQIIPEPQKKSDVQKKSASLNDKVNGAKNIIELEAVWKGMKPDEQKLMQDDVKKRKAELIKEATYPPAPDPQIIKDNPMLTDVTYFIQCIESEVKKESCVEFFKKHETYIRALKASDQRLVDRVYQAQIVKLEGGK